MIIICQHCKRKILLTKGSDGKNIQCPHCHGKFILKTDDRSIVLKPDSSASSDINIVVDAAPSRRTTERITVIHLTGSVDTPAVRSLQEIFDKQMEEKNFDVILDMAGVRYINSVGMGVLVSLKNNLVKNFGDLKICGVRDNVERLMKVIGLLKLFKLYSSVENAKKAFSGDFDNFQKDIGDGPRRMVLIKCLICGKTSEISNHDRCKSYLKITRNYVWEHRNASIEEVAHETGVPESFVHTIVSNNWFVTSGGFYSEIDKK